MCNMKDKEQGYCFFVKWSLLIKVLVKALEAIEAGQKSPLFKYLLIIFFVGKTRFFDSLF